MKSLTIFVLVLACTYATEDIFAELKESDFGKTLAKTIEVELASNTGDNVDHVVGMLKDVRSGLRDDQQRASDAYGVIADSCRADFDAMDRKEDSLEAAYTKNERLVMIDGPVHDDRVTEKANRVDELAARTQAAEDLEGENERLTAAFNDVVAQHNAVRTMMHTARGIMQEAFNPTSEFLQVKTSAMGKLAAHIRAFKTEPNTLSHGYAQIFNVIAMIAERAQTNEVANDGMFDTLMRIFDDIEENLETSLSIEREAERQRLEAFAELRERLGSEISGLRVRINELGQEILALQLSLSQYEEAMDGATGALGDLAELRADRQAFCDAEDGNYQYQNSELQYQITTVGNAIYLLEDKRDLLERFRS